MDHLLLGGHAAIDFLNTSLAPDGVPIERIADGRSYVEWLVAAGLLEETHAAKLARRFGGEALDAAAAEARKTREWARAWLVGWRAKPGGDYREELATLNRLLAREVPSRVVVATDDGFRLIASPQARERGRAHGLIAEQIATLITLEDASLGEGVLWSSVHVVVPRSHKGASTNVL